jgi:TolB-like protein/Tfp pilus assembly protein PilF
MSAQQRDEYLEVGMADSLISELNATGRLVVLPASSARQYGGEGRNGAAAGGQLKVDAVIEGSVQRLDNALRVTARLVRVKDGALLWAGSIDGTFANLFNVQDSLARQIIGALSLKLTPAQQSLLTRRTTADPDAYEWYQKGRFFAGRRTADGFERAIAYYQRAIDKDPRYALAWSGLSDAHMLTAWYSTRPVKTAHALAKAAALRAVALDDSLAEAHTSLAVVHENADWAFRDAEREFQKALLLNPNYPTAHHWYGEFLGLMGHTPDALAHLRRAQQLDPLSTIVGADTAKVLIDARRYDEAILECQRMLELDPNFAPARGWLYMAYAWNGMYRQAEAEQDRMEAGRSPVDSSLGKAVFYTLAGQPAKAAEFSLQFHQIAKTESVHTWQFALFYILVQPDKDKAFEWLQKAYDERSPYLMAAKVAPDFDPVRSDPRFHQLLHHINFLD